MKPKAIDVSVLIVNYNTRELLDQCLASLYRHATNLNIEVMVADNASSDSSCQMVRIRYPAVHLIALPDNEGFARATNRLMQESTGRYVLLLNPDTVVLDRAVEHMVAFLDSNPRIGACGCRLFYADGRQQRNGFPMPTVLSGLFDYSPVTERLPHLVKWWLPDWPDRPDTTRPVGFISGACMLISRHCVQEIGPLDETFFLYGEDVDWCRRMWRCGWEVWYLAEGEVVHLLGASQSSSARRRLGELRGRLQYLRKWHGRPYVMAYLMLVRLCMVYRLAKTRWRQFRSDEGGSAPDQVDFLWTVLAGRV